MKKISLMLSIVMVCQTIFAPKAKVIVGQVNKTIYGRIVARGVSVHQYTKVYRVDFNPIGAMQVAYVHSYTK